MKIVSDPILVGENHLQFAIYDMRPKVKLQSILSIILGLFICILLVISAYIFTAITDDLVIKPIEEMIKRVKNITKDPLKAAQEEEERMLYEEMAENERKDKMKSTRIKEFKK